MLAYPIKMFFWIAVCVPDAAVVNPNGTKTFLANSLSTFPIKGKPVFSNGTKSLIRNSPNCAILDSWVYEIFLLADEPFAKALRILETCVSVNNNLCEKLSSLESPTTFDESFQVTWVPFFILDFNSLSCELDKLTFKVLYWVILYWYYITAK